MINAVHSLVRYAVLYLSVDDIVHSICDVCSRAIFRTRCVRPVPDFAFVN